MRTHLRTLVVAMVLGAATLATGACARRANTGPESIQPSELASLLASPKPSKPLILQVGFRVLYQQAHIPGSEYIGAASEPDGLSRLRTRVKSLPRGAFIVIYCGCCPWNRCPNIKPAYAALKAMGFSNVRELRLLRNFGADWVDKGYPVAKGP